MPFERMMGIVPLGIGLTVLGFAWMQPFGGFGAMPLFGRFFFSLIALGFVLIGAKTLSGGLTNPQHLARMLRDVQSKLPEELTPPPDDEAEHGQVGYRCDNCGAPLSKDADVSPHGDVKCAHCDRWFNIHSRT